MVTSTANKAVLIGIAFASPFFILNALVAAGVPVVETLRIVIQTTTYEQFFVLGLIALVFIGGIISVYPVVKTRTLLILNIVVGVFLIGFSVMAGYGLGVDVYHCDILKIPNCD